VNHKGPAADASLLGWLRGPKVPFLLLQMSAKSKLPSADQSDGPPGGLTEDLTARYQCMARLGASNNRHLRGARLSLIHI